MIEFSYDEEARACYITIGEPLDEQEYTDITRTVCVDPMINLDYRPGGSLYGIEVLLPDRGE